MRLAVLGGGHGALCMAADLSLAGHEVRLYLRNRQRFAETFETKRIRIGGAGRTGEAAVSLVTDEVGQALDGAEMVLVPLPAYAHEDIARRAAPHLKAGQVVYLTPGTFGSFVFAKTVREAGGPAIVTAEAATLPYGTRISGPSEVRVTMVAAHLPTGVFPASRTAEALARIKSVYEVAEPVTDALDSALLNVNGALHASLTIMNAGPIESMEAFDIHREGSTPAILRVMAALEGERIALRKALGYPPPHWPIMDYYAHRDWLYGVRGRQLVEQQSVWHEKIDLRGRYVEEDVRFGLALWESLGRKLGVPTPLSEAFLHIAGAMNGADYIASGQSLEKLGLAELSLPQLKALLREGF
ncbi:MAG TPA: NAD/NADP octopine/nopaline dehydrogenase family protein [Chloroflexota bacterium]|nr:NAD/NADP octopine/nopaline dehydrogenase family protein [Chloroflexota bacterium]